MLAIMMVVVGGMAIEGSADVRGVLDALYFRQLTGLTLSLKGIASVLLSS